jgi:uncharacterized protein (DUF697 family)
VNKKKLPKAIRPVTAKTIVPIEDEIATETTAPVAQQNQSQSSGKSADTVEAARKSVETAQKEAVTTKTAASPRKIEVARDARRAQAAKLVERFALWSGVAGLLPIPFVDLAAVGGLQLQMLRRITQIYDVAFSENRGKALVASLAGSMLPATGAIGVASLMKGVPILGTTVSSLTMPGLSMGATYAIGIAFIQHFSSGGTLLDFDPPNYREFIKAHSDAWNARSKAAPTPTAKKREVKSETVS